jgi:hypothetical protein
MRVFRNRFAMSGLVLGTVATILLLFGQNSGMISLSAPFVAVIWWVLAWPFTFAALVVANTATGTQMSPGWGMPLLILSIVLNLAYFYVLGWLAGRLYGRVKG